MTRDDEDDRTDVLDPPPLRPAREPDGAGGYVDDRPAQTDWQLRIERAKRNGSWYADDEEQCPMPTRQRVRRFVTAFGIVLLLSLVIESVITLVRGEPFDLDLLIDAVFSGGFSALLAGTFFAFPRGRPRPPGRHR